MTAPTKALPGYRLVTVKYGDNLRKIAIRELGDADQWRDLITINGLTFPYVTSDPALASATCILAGGQIKVPAPSTTYSAVDDPDRVYGVDLLLSDGQLQVANGDLATVAGADNLRQAYRNRIDTPLGDLEFHQDYGCQVHELKGDKNTPYVATLGSAFVAGALMNDPRTQAVPSATVQVVGDTLEITATAQPIAGSSVDVQTSG
ncbi:MAG TPA: hypothetical protein VJP88_04550 [Caulobacteraceae bacterium]|nr:hypothetical protein [Caulobacteraceae bacterium]